MSNGINRLPIPAGLREKYNALDRELFWDIADQNLFIRWNGKWRSIAGTWKAESIVADEFNLEIVFPEGDTKHYYPELRLKNNIILNSMELGKFSTAPHWKGFTKLGEVENTSFFPVLKLKANSSEIVCGKFLIRATRHTFNEYGVYHATLCSRGRASIYGSDDQNVKDTINILTFPNGEQEIGFKTFEATEEIITQEIIHQSEIQLSREIDFVIFSKNDIRFTSSEGGSARFTRRTDVWSTGNEAVGGTGVNHCAWYEMSMGDFRAITGITTYTGTSLDAYDNNSYIYFDIYIPEDGQQNIFSIDRVFITQTRANTEDEMVSDARVWCHNPYWLTPNDQHRVDVSDSFLFLSNIFNDGADNTPFTPGEAIKIMDVYMNIPGGDVIINHRHTIVAPPVKIEVWFNGWDTRLDENKPVLSNRSDNYTNSITIAPPPTTNSMT